MYTDEYIHLDPLFTSKNSKIWYGKHGVGKDIGGKTYVSKYFAHLVVPKDILSEAFDLMIVFFPDFRYNVIIWEEKTRIIKFVSCPTFNLVREPVVGKIATIDMNTSPSTLQIKITKSKQIYHHKWLFVKPSYEGFDVQESYDWSKTWLSKLNESASGYPDKWKKQLNSVGLE